MTDRTRITLVRHADTLFTEQRLIHGSLDSPLSERGLRQSRLAAQRLHGAEFDAHYSSPLGRSMATAAIIGEAIGLEPVPVAGLAERDFGWMEGSPLPGDDAGGFKVLLSRVMIRVSLLLSGERDRDFRARVVKAIDGILSSHAGERTLIVTHWGVLSMTVSHLLDEDHWRRLQPESWHPCGITEMEERDDGWRVIHLDDTGHITPGGE